MPRNNFADVEIDVFFGMADNNNDGNISKDVRVLMLM
jgi:hypothetical protein